MRPLIFFSLLFIGCAAKKSGNADVKRWEEQAARVTIIRDTWGIPHVYGKTDADAVFGLLYAQCEESFEKVERAYLEKLGRLSEAEGEGYLYSDLLNRLLCDTAAAIEQYRKSPPEMRKLLDAFADGINFYLHKNTSTKPLLLTHFEPWYALLFTDGAYVSVKTDNLSLDDMKRMYNLPASTSFLNKQSDVATGSNGFAVAPAKTVNKKALLYINPHVSFYFRMEAHMVSEEGLNAYGAVTWGQFFIFQGFNEHCGWMHTSSMADAADLYADSLVQKENSLYTVYDETLKPVTHKQITIAFKKGGIINQRQLMVYYTHHGPVVGRQAGGKVLSLAFLPSSLTGLQQSWLRTKAKNFAEFKATLEMVANATTNTVYADGKGNIGYWHGNFIPIKDAGYDWTKPVKGSTSKTAWRDAHSLSEIAHTENPPQGFVQNCNSSPFHVSGTNTLNKEAYPFYMVPDGENFRSVLAIKTLQAENGFTLDKLISLGFNPYLAAFDTLLPPLFNAYNNLPPTDAVREQLKAPITLLQAWDKRCDKSSIATTLAIEWAYLLLQQQSNEAAAQTEWMAAAVRNTPDAKLLQYMAQTVAGLEKNYGTWQLPWGEINRYQRPADGEAYNDGEPSLPVGFASALFGCLPAFEPVWNKTAKGYGYAGNSFVAAVEFGQKVKAKAVVPGGQSFDPASKHFSDQAALYITGKLRDVFFYRNDVERNKEKVYRPGE